MKSLVLLCYFLPIVMLGQSSFDELIDFDKKNSTSYSKKNMLISGTLDLVYNFDLLKTAPKEVWLENVSANFMVYEPKYNFCIYPKQESGLYDLLKKYQHARLYFLISPKTAIPKLIGYSKELVVLSEFEKQLEVDDEVDNYIDFSNVNASDYKGTYIVGAIDIMKHDALIPLLFKKEIFLSYPEYLWGSPKLFLYGKVFPLNKPISISLLEKISKNGINIVLKRVGDTYVIKGFITDKKHKELFKRFK